MITGVLSLIRTLMQIVLLQKGPEAFPRAPVILLFCVALWMVSSAIALFSVDGSSSSSFMLGIVERLLPLLIDEQQVNSLLTLVLLWSVPVEGHIIARAIDRFWYVGLVAASTVFIVQLFLLASLSPAIETDSTSAEEVVAQPA